MSLWPSKNQWKSWSLPSKLTAIGVLVSLVAIPLTIIIPLTVNYFSGPSLTDIVRAVGEEYKTELDKKYPTAHAVFGVYQEGFIVPKGQIPENLEIDWKTGKVQSTSSNMLRVTIPDMVLNGKSFVGGNVTQVEKRIGAKSGSIIQLGWFNPILEVIGVDDDLVVIALGFPSDNSKQE